MKVIIFHHHLRGGGVTRIIESQIKSLLLSAMNKEAVSVLSGSVPHDEKIPGISYTVAPELQYLYREEVDSKDLDKTLERISHIFRSAVTREDILHIHNYGLGKNPLVTYVIYLMALDGYRIFNHCHDFAEDRPDNIAFLEEVISGYFGTPVKEVLYPKRNNFFYGVINRTDLERIVSAGVPEKLVSYLPNPVDPEEFSPALKLKSEMRKKVRKILSVVPEKRLVTYPVRVIRRKNIQEVLLLAILFREEITFAITLAPENPVEVEYYRYWRRFSEQHNLPVLFDVAEKVDFRELITGSDFCITTSTMEGFGMTFLEPWLTDTPVIGRNLPSVTRDFSNAGVVFSGLYNAITVQSYNNRDFKDLSKEECSLILKEFISSFEKRKQFLNDNPDLTTLFFDIPIETIQQNRLTISERYSLKNYGTRLIELYKRLSE